jgi:Ankyrin repeats (many copies)
MWDGDIYNDATASNALSIMSTIEWRHITHSIYHYLPIHRQEGYRAIHEASSDGHVEVVKLLLDKGADIEAKTNVSHISMEWYFG